MTLAEQWIDEGYQKGGCGLMSKQLKLKFGANHQSLSSPVEF